MPRILLIEDISDNAVLVKKALGSQGLDVVWVDTAEAGLQQARAQKPSLILLDLGLPDMDGQTLVSYLRKEPDLRDVPIIVVTAWPEETARQMVEAYGCDAFIGKPLNVRQFIQTVNHFLSRGQGHEPLFE